MTLPAPPEVTPQGGVGAVSLSGGLISEESYNPIQ